MDSAASDPFFLNWGSSVNVNEDLRRGIRTDIEEIESSIKILQSNIRSEDKSEFQLTKDFSHAYGELLNLRRFAGDDLDNSTMNAQIQMRLRESLATEFLAVISPPSLSNSDSTPIAPQDCGNGENSVNERNLGRYIGNCSDIVTILKDSIRNESEIIEDYKAKLSSLKYNIDSIQSRVEREVKTQSSLNREVDVQRKDWEAEKQRIRGVKESIQQARKQSGHYAQMIADYSKTLSSNKRLHADVKSTICNEIESNEKGITSLVAELTAMEKESATLSARYDTLLLQFTEREEIHKLRDDKKKEREKKEKKIDSLKTKKTDLSNLVANLKANCKADEVKFHESRKRRSSVEDLHTKNNEKDKEMEKLVNVVQPKYLKEKEQLAKEMTELHEQSKSKKDEFEKTHKMNEMLLSDLDVQLKNATAEIETKKEKVKQLEQFRIEASVSSSEEIKECKKFKESFEEALKAQQVRLEEQERHLQQTRRKQIDEQKTQLNSIREAEKFKQKVIEEGIKILLKTKEMEDFLLNSEIHLNEKGEEIKEQYIEDPVKA